MLKNIIFDLGNVIAKFDPYAIYHRFADSKEEAQELYDLIYSSGLWLDLDRGVELDVIIDTMKQNTPDYVHDKVEKIIHEWITVLEIDPLMENVVYSLSQKGYNIYLLSNVSKQFYEFRDKNALFDIFDGLYVSADHKLVKPDHDVYEHFLEKYNLDPAQCLFVDDRLENVIGAREVGIETYHYQDDLHAFLKYLEVNHSISLDTK